MSRFSPRATVTQCAVLVGNQETSPGALTATTPTPMMTVGDRPFLAWLMREMQRYGVEEFLLLAAHRSDRFEHAADELRSFLPKPARIVLSVGPHGAGTGGALHHARSHLHERFLLCRGDSLFDCNLASLLASAARTAGETNWMVLRAVQDTQGNDVVVMSPDTESIAHIAASPPPGHPGLIGAGIFLFGPGLLAHLSPSCSLEADVLPMLAARGQLRGVVDTGYLCDIGTPDHLARAQAELPARLHRAALFLDRDGVINHDHGWVGTRERFTWTPDAREAIRVASTAGRHVFVVTNQSGIARGHYDEVALDALHRWMIDEIRLEGGTIDDLRFCPYHEDAVVDRYRRRSDWRKPEPGMILDLMRAWALDPARCLLIGDQQTDLQAARAAGIEARLTRGGDLLSLLATAGIAAC